jgi:ParB family chromosome partitioning protein
MKELRQIKLADIDAGGRQRKNMGDIDELAHSIEDVGLLQPVVVTLNGTPLPNSVMGKSRGEQSYWLLAGGRRLAAVAKLGWEKVPAYVVNGFPDAVMRLRAERDENTCRKDFTPSEAVAIGKALEELERKKAKERQKKHGGTAPGRKGDTGGNLPPVKGKTRDKVAEVVGMSPRTYEKAKAVVEAAEADPDLQPVVEEMDRTGKVDPAHKKVKPRKTAAERAEAKARREEEKRIDLGEYFDRWWGESEGRLVALAVLDDDACRHLTAGERFYLDKLIEAQEKLLPRLREIRDKAKAKKAR